ncbi:uncharacterized protein [Aquarana catesbeiana]|uniref:uncharacterized protein isoform X2 n=1 Tax=Aquarana catesbeiana TaxID=8400 RepID=UPI003CC9DE17
MPPACIPTFEMSPPSADGAPQNSVYFPAIGGRNRGVTRLPANLYTPLGQAARCAHRRGRAGFGSIVRKRRQSGRRGKQVSLLPHEKELLAAVGEDEIKKLLAHQDRLQAQRRRRQRAEEQESSTSSCSVIQSERETEEEAEAATPTSAEQEVEETCPVEAAGDAEEQPDAADPGSEVFILQLQPVDEDLDLPVSGWTGCPSESPVVSTVLHPSTSPHLASPVHPSPAPEQAHIPHPPEPHVTDYLRPIVEVQKRHFAVTRRLRQSLALHNHQQLRHSVALQRYQRSLRRHLEATRYLGDQLAGINMSLQRLVTRLGENVL